MAISDLSSAIRELVRSQHGITSIEGRLGGGLSDSFVYLVNAEKDRKVLKLQEPRQELAFYRDIAATMMNDSSWTPLLFGMGEVGKFNWLLLEHIVFPWPDHRFNFDQEAIGRLPELHATEIQPNFMNWVEQAWPGEHLEALGKHLPSRTISQLVAIHSEYEKINRENLTLCSGDPNVPNWRVRCDDTAVLLDWQRVCFENRALDLAGWLANMATYADMLELASIYLGSSDIHRCKKLARDIAIFFCRRCSMNFWYAEKSSTPQLWEEGNQRMASQMPEWLDTLMADMARSGYGIAWE